MRVTTTFKAALATIPSVEAKVTTASSVRMVPTSWMAVRVTTLWMAASAMGNHGALDVASRQGAYFLGASEDIGTIEVGKLADLIVLNSNPLEDIHNTLDMRYVVKGGVMYAADTLDELWPRDRPFGDYYWVDPEIYRNDDRPVDYHDN